MNILYKTGIVLIMLVFLTGCIGTDVVEEVMVDERVTITSRIETLSVGEMFQFEAAFFDQFGELASADINWESSDESIVSITNQGLATALMRGDVTVFASNGSVRDSLMIMASDTTILGQTVRMGQFRGVNNYQVSGSFSLEETDTGLQLVLGDDFRTNNGPGLYVYLSNSELSVSGGFEVDNLIRSSGRQTYTINNPDIELNTFNHVIVYCKPFGLAFGTGRLSN